MKNYSRITKTFGVFYSWNPFKTKPFEIKDRTDQPLDGHKSPLITIARGAAWSNNPLGKRVYEGSWRETVDRCRSRPRNYQPCHAALQPPLSRHRIRSDLPPRIPSLNRREREGERLAPSVANNATLCALYASALLQDTSFRCRESLHPSEGGGNKGWRSWNTSPLDRD